MAEDPLDVLLDDGVIDEVLGRIKSGKEATISMVRRGDAILAAKVYKDRDTRSFKNNTGYKEGRKVRNTRTQRAMDSGGKFGRDSAEQAWKSAEADALYKLAGTGVRIPEPVMFYEGVLLMELVRAADGSPAPRLEEISLEKDAALGIYADLLAQLITMLCSDMIHGDLSPYNILLAADGPTIIDFPQVISAAHNTRAEHYFLRDFTNVHSFLASFDPALAVHRVDGRAIWQAYVRRDLTPEFVPPPPPPIQPRRNERVFEPRNRGPQQRNDNRGPQQSFDNRGARPNGPPQRSFGNRGPQPSTDNRGPQPSTDNRGPQPSTDNRGPQPSTDNRAPQHGSGNRGPQQSFGDRGPQQRNGNRGPQQSFGNRGPQQSFGNRGPQRSFDTHGQQPFDAPTQAPPSAEASPPAEEQLPVEWKESDWSVGAPSAPAPPRPPKAPAPPPWDPRKSVGATDRRPNDARPNDSRGKGRFQADRRPTDSRFNRPGSGGQPPNGPRSNGPRSNDSSSNGPRSNDQPSNGPRANEPRVERTPLQPGESPFARRRELERGEFRARDPNQPPEPPRPAQSAPATSPDNQRRRRRRFGS